ncbi:MAG: hypothetical protein HXS47_08320 [Theionarchaea archaeon]|nr:hypothetical protein [Theionarchaea archaeon]
MYPMKTKERGSRYVRSLYELSQSVEERIPTFNRSLDRYFDAHFEAIIDEWQLLTDRDLRDLERRVDHVTEEIDRLYLHKSVLETQVAKLTEEITFFEGGEEE